MSDKLTAIFQPAEDGEYFCYIKEVPGAVSQGETLKDASVNLMDAFELLMEVDQKK